MPLQNDPRLNDPRLERAIIAAYRVLDATRQNSPSEGREPGPLYPAGETAQDIRQRTPAEVRRVLRYHLSLLADAA